MASISDNLKFLMEKGKLENLGVDFKGQAVGNGEPWKAVEQGSDCTKITLRLSEHQSKRKQSKQGPSAPGPIRSVWGLGLASGLGSGQDLGLESMTLASRSLVLEAGASFPDGA